jgi:peptidoglycan/LPS O-acetylase OafA/YrhL
MYISHFAIIHFILKLKISDRIGIKDLNLNFMVLFTILIISTFYISKILYNIIEKPGIDLGKKIIAKYSS